jgi:hypothetical protein
MRFVPSPVVATAVSCSLAAAACSADTARAWPHSSSGSDASAADAAGDAVSLQDGGGVAVDGPADTAADSTVHDGAVAEAAASETGQPPGPDAPVGPDGPAWIVDGVALCPEAAPFCNAAADASATLQMCIDRTPDGMALELEPCRYSLQFQLVLAHPLTVRTRGKAGAPSCALDDGHGCTELFALPAFNQGFGMLKATAAVTLDHLVLNGNRQNRAGTAAWSKCTSLADNSFGFNASFFCSSCTLQDSVSKYALCGTGFLAAPGSSITITRNIIAFNGVHKTQNLWADGLTVHDAVASTFTANQFIDNTDIDLIFGGCKHCKITGNTVTHTADANGGAFAAIMIQKWPSTSGSYEGVDISGNHVDCGPSRACGSGLYIGSESWYPETPYGTLVEGTTSGTITNNTVVNAMNALYIAAQGLAIYGNGFLNAHGVAIPNSCHKTMVSSTPIVVSPTTKSCHFNFENVDPVMKVHYSSASWAGCIPNFPF